MRAKKEPKYIQLPRGYISYSQIQLWQNDPKRYEQLYFDNRDELRFDNKGMKYGKVVADLLERGEGSEDVLTDTAMSLLKKYDIRDQELRAELKIKEGIIPILAKPDTMDSKSFDFREYKTGKTPWTQKKAQNHFQMKFYHMGIYLKHGKFLKEAYLDWIETHEEDGVIKPTGRIESFRVVFSMQDLLETMTLVAKIAKEIEIAFASHTPDPKLAW